MKLTLPDPSLVALIGVAGAGKSTFARQHFLPTEIVSSDHCRALVSDEENNQTVNQQAFEILHLIAASRLTYHKLTVIDATNVQREARAQLLALAREHRIPAVAVVLNFDLESCLHRNAQRGHRVVPPDIILQQYADLQKALGTLTDEGFHTISILGSPADAETLIIKRKKSRRRKSTSG